MPDPGPAGRRAAVLLFSLADGVVPPLKIFNYDGRWDYGTSDKWDYGTSDRSIMSLADLRISDRSAKSLADLSEFHRSAKLLADL